MAARGSCGKPPGLPSELSAPKPFEVYESGLLLHGTKAQLEVGDLLLPGLGCNVEEGRVADNV